MAVYYYIDRSEMRENYYTPAYIPEVLSALGVTGQEINPDKLNTIQSTDVVFAPESVNLPECRRIIYPLCCGREPGIKAQVEIGGTEIFLVVPLSGEAVKDEGNTLRFGFDLPGQILWAGDGFEREPQHGFFAGRVPDTVPLPEDGKAEEPYNDCLLKLIADKLLMWGVPLFAPICPMNGVLPDMGFMVSGDDDCSDREINLEAAQAMAGLNVPYHINAMAAGGTAFCMDKDDFDTLASLGCETAMHLDLTQFLDCPEKAVREQTSLFEETFGRKTVTNSNHCFIQPASCPERLGLLAEQGVIAANSKLGEVDPEDINAFGLTGFGFGTVHPRYSMTEKGDSIECMELPITCYEPRVGGRYGDGDYLIKYLQTVEKYMGVAQFFIHPHYLCADNSDSPMSVAALKLALEFFENRKVWFTTADNFALWHRARRRSSVTLCGDAMTVKAAAPMAVFLPSGAVKAVCGGEELTVRSRFGSSYVALPEGEYRIQLLY